ncbi:hypothetical protein [Sinorhizobium meliloti]|uniref:hypothetical protein n=1 Tax=Rhizobium meliloti TaxID=382 RepID=UPI0012FD8EA9|nr:hypothetical protein [Sinorhizobium meliloti]
MAKNDAVTIRIVTAGAVLLGLISVLIVGAVVYTAVAFNKVPEVLANWGGLIVGFFIGNFFNFLKAALDISDAKHSPPDKGT